MKLELKLRTKTLLLLAVFALMFLSVAIFTIVTVQDKVITTAHEKLKADSAMGKALLNARYSGDWSIKDGKLFKGDTQMNDNYAIVDSIGELTSDTVTIFQGDMRITTNVKNAQGDRAVGTKAANNVIDDTLKKGQTYIGKANVVGTWNQTAYEPIRDAQGNIIGMFYVGVPNTHYDQVVKEISIKVAVASGVALIVVFILGVFMVNSITKPVNNVIAGISDGALQITASSSQVSAASQHLAEGSSEQAASLEETSSSMEELASMTKHNADSAKQAKAMMGEVQRIVENVNMNMLNMAEAISNVTNSSSETGKIIKTIDEIAFQTNLLALNAAVEAARAGEAGAGFAVVANEVRNLAMRAAEAAKNTSDLIENTIKAVAHGNELTKLTQDAFKENIEISMKIGSIIDEIAAASQEQSQGIELINKAVAQMDKVTQQTAANAEDSASAAEEMNTQAEKLKNFVCDLSAIVNGNGHGVVVESQSKPLSKKLTSLLHLHKNAPLIPEKKVIEKLPVTQRRKMVKSDQVIPVEGTHFKNF
jgi:methyl-accepting chemotaxis protein